MSTTVRRYKLYDLNDLLYNTTFGFHLYSVVIISSNDPRTNFKITLYTFCNLWSLKSCKHVLQDTFSYVDALVITSEVAEVM